MKINKVIKLLIVVCLSFFNVIAVIEPIKAGDGQYVLCKITNPDVCLGVYTSLQAVINAAAGDYQIIELEAPMFVTDSIIISNKTLHFKRNGKFSAIYALRLDNSTVSFDGSLAVGDVGSSGLEIYNGSQLTIEGDLNMFAKIESDSFGVGQNIVDIAGNVVTNSMIIAKRNSFISIGGNVASTLPSGQSAIFADDSEVQIYGTLSSNQLGVFATNSHVTVCSTLTVGDRAVEAYAGSTVDFKGDLQSNAIAAPPVIARADNGSTVYFRGNINKAAYVMLIDGAFYSQDNTYGGSIDLTDYWEYYWYQNPGATNPASIWIAHEFKLRSPEITPASPNSFTCVKPTALPEYSSPIRATSLAPLSYSVSSSLPTGVILSPVLSPTFPYNQTGVRIRVDATAHPGIYNLNIVVSDNTGMTADTIYPFTLIITEAPTISSGNSFTAVAGKLSKFQLTSGSPVPVTWELLGAPAGVTVSPNPSSNTTMYIDATVPSGVYDFAIKATNGTLPDCYQSFTLTVFPVDKYTGLVINVDNVNPFAANESMQYFRSTKKTKGFKLVGTTAADCLIDPYLKPGTTYYYKQRIVKTVGTKKTYGKYTTVKSDATLKLPAVNDVTVTGVNKGIKIDWTNKNDMSAIQFYYTADKKITSKTKWKILSIFDNNYTFGNLKGDTDYQYKIRYIYNNGNVSYSAFTPVKTVHTTNSGTATFSSDSYATKNIPITPVIDAEFYEVYRSAKPTSGFTLIATVPTANCTDFNLTAGKTYYYRVRSGKLVGGKKQYSAYQPTVKVVVPNLPSVSGINATSGPGLLNISWDSGYTAVQIYYATTNTTKTKWNIITVDSKNGYFTLRKLAANKKYFYKIRYVYQFGTASYGPFSEVKSATTN